MGFETYHNHDVLSGRGHKNNIHPGNVFFRALVRKLKPMYRASSCREDKNLFARQIVGQIKGMNPPGRFLKKSDKNHLWEEIGSKDEIDKTKQTLREGDVNPTGGEERVEQKMNKREICQLVSKYAREVYEEGNHGDINKQTFRVLTQEIGFMDIDDLPTLSIGLQGPLIPQTVQSVASDNPNRRVLEHTANATLNKEFTTKPTFDFQPSGSRNRKVGPNTLNIDPNLTFQPHGDFDKYIGAYNNDSGENQHLHFYDIKNNNRVSVSESLISWEPDISNSVLKKDSIHARASFNHFPSPSGQLDKAESVVESSITVNDHNDELKMSTLTQDPGLNTSYINSRDIYNQSPPLVSKQSDDFDKMKPVVKASTRAKNDLLKELNMSCTMQDPKLDSGNRSSLDSLELMADQIKKLNEDYGFENSTDFSEFRMSLDEEHHEDFDELMESVRSLKGIDFDVLREHARSLNNEDSCRTDINLGSGPRFDDFQRLIRMSLIPRQDANDSNTKDDALKLHDDNDGYQNYT